MSTITKEFTKEQLIEKLQHRISVASGFPESEKAQMDLELARIALASLEAEAVADVVAWSSQNEERTCDVRLRRHDIKPGPLYTAPPATVSVPAALDNDIDSDDHPLLWSYNNGWNAYRAAMLQGAVQPQNQQQNIPENIPVNTPCKEAPEYIWLQTAGVWPENGEFSELTWCSDNQHEDDTLYVRADVVSGNSPVITDGWVNVVTSLRVSSATLFDVRDKLHLGGNSFSFRILDALNHCPESVGHHFTSCCGAAASMATYAHSIGPGAGLS
ncbi:hypothetical protein [Enterobacter ludwigii]|uniref:hypothetical protein n=1 Tax=Enterobacter ludwigii TaxID=299767 RepID=UPI0032AFB1D8